MGSQISSLLEERAVLETEDACCTGAKADAEATRAKRLRELARENFIVDGASKLIHEIDGLS
jgi:hypothetical protein